MYIAQNHHIHLDLVKEFQHVTPYYYHHLLYDDDDDDDDDDNNDDDDDEDDDNNDNDDDDNNDNDDNNNNDDYNDYDDYDNYYHFFLTCTSMSRSTTKVSPSITTSSKNCVISVDSVNTSILHIETDHSDTSRMMMMIMVIVL